MTLHSNNSADRQAELADKLVDIENRSARRDFDARLKARRSEGLTGKAGAILLQHRRRIKDLRRLIENRHQHVLDDNHYAHVDVEEYAAHLLKGEKRKVARDMVAILCPMLSSSKLDEIMQRASKKRALKKGDVGDRISLTREERYRLETWTIAAYDETPDLRKQHRRESRRDAKAAERYRKGTVTRDEYSWAAKTEPWRWFGWSRRTWERKGKPIPGQAQVDASASPPRNEVPSSRRRTCDSHYGSAGDQAGGG
jgi:hypothetical protein